jgi:hypothetical protein
VPGHIRDLVRECGQLKIHVGEVESDFDEAQQQIHMIRCQRDEARRALADAMRWRPMSEAPEDNSVVVVMVLSMPHLTTTPLTKTFQSIGQGWLPLPPLPTAPVTAKLVSLDLGWPHSDTPVAPVTNGLPDPDEFERLYFDAAARVAQEYPKVTMGDSCVSAATAKGAGRFTCSRPAHHDGPHVSYGMHAPVAWWPNRPMPEAQ